MDKEKETRILHLAHQFAEIHIMDGDILGRMAHELLELIDERDFHIQDLPMDEE